MAQRSSRSKEEVGEIIKSILVAEKKASTIGMPIVELEEEYKAQDGTRIPYRALGYSCLMDFLENLQGKGEIIIGKRGSMPVVYLCVDEKIAHVSALVSRQKDSSKRCSRGGKRNPITSRMYPRVNNPVSSSRLDSKTLADVLKLVKSAPNGINVARIIEYLRDRNILTVDDQQLIRQLREISHQVSVENATIYPIMTTKKKIINSVTPPKTNDNFTGEKKPSPAYRPAGLSDEEEDDDDEVTFEFVRASDRVQSTISASQNNNVNQFYQDSHVNNCDENSNARSQKNDDKFKREDYCDEMEILVNTRTRFRLEKLIQKHPDGIWCAELPNIYHQEYCVPLNYEDLGFGNLSDFAAHLPDIFHCVRLQENGDFKLFDAKAPKPELRSNPRPKHLSLAALHNIYESYRDETDPVPVLLSPTTSQRLVPEGVMTIGETVAQIFVTQLFSDNIPHIDVVVVDTVTPTLFWIQLLRKTQKFDRFMRDLHAFYTEHASKYPIPIVVLERGLNCACMFDNKWHRGVIKAVKANSTVTVFFYDYGTVKTYPPQDIHFLHRSFSSLPAQAIPCGLYNVKPISTEKWPYSVCQVFAEKVLDVPMVAMLGSIDADNNSMLIALTNTDGAVDFHISDWMISSGFAVYGKMVCIRPPNYPFRHYVECKHGNIIPKEKETSSLKKIVSYDDKKNIASAPQSLSLPDSGKTSANSFSLYETVLKLHRESRKNSSLDASTKSNISSHDSSAPPRKETRPFNTEQTCPSKNNNYGTNLLTKLCKISQANQKAILTANEKFTSQSDLNESKSLNRDASSSTASVILPDCKNLNVEIKCDGKIIPENREILPRPKRFEKLAKLVASNGFKPIVPSTKSNETKSSSSSSSSADDNKNREKRWPRDTPLHLRSEIAERTNGTKEFGAFYSPLGGHGLMEPIDWNKLRNEENFNDNANLSSHNKIPSKTWTPLEIHSKLKEKNAAALENFQKPIEHNDYSNIHFDNNSDASIEFTVKSRGKEINPEKYRASAKLDRETERRKNSFQETEIEVENFPLLKDWAKTDEKYSIKRYLELPVSEEKASKPHVWNLPKVNNSANRHGEIVNHRHKLRTEAAEKMSTESHREIEYTEGKSLAPRPREPSKSHQAKHSEKSNKENNIEKTTSKPETKDFPRKSTSVVENSPSTNSTSKLAPKKAAFINFVRNNMKKKEEEEEEEEDLVPEFGHFHSKFGGNGRSEAIDWSVIRNPETPEKIEPAKEVALKSEKKKTIVKRCEPVGKRFFNIINSVLPPPNQRDSLCVPEGNTMIRQADLSPKLRIILTSVNQDIQDKQIRLFIPDDFAETLEIDDSTSISSDSSTDSGANKCTVKYQSLRKSRESRGSTSSDTIPNSTESERSSASNDSPRDFDSTNDALEIIISGSASKSGEKLLKSTDTSATGSQASPSQAAAAAAAAAARSDGNSRVTRQINYTSELIADEENTRSPKAGKIIRDSARKRVDFNAESGFIENLKKSSGGGGGGGTPTENCPLKSKEKRTEVKVETISSENMEKQMDSSRKLTKEQQMVKSRVFSTYSITDASKKLSVFGEEKIPPNACIQNSSLKSNDSIFTSFSNFFVSRNDSADNSDLDSDDFSSDEESKKNDEESTELEESVKENQSSKVESGFANKINDSIVAETSEKTLDSIDDRSTLNYDFSIENAAENLDKNLEISDEKIHRETNKWENSQDLETNGENAICRPARKTTAAASSCSKEAKEGEQRIVLWYDDTCNRSEDDEEWDFVPFTSLQSLNIDNNNKHFINPYSYETINEFPEIEKSQHSNSHGDDDLEDLSRANQQKDASFATDDINKNIHSENYTCINDSTNSDDDDDDDYVYNIHDDSTQENENTDSDKNSMLTKESIENNPNVANESKISKVCAQSSHSILNEVQKLNISATPNAFTHINSHSSASSSSSSKDQSYTQSFMRSLKQYL